jgi:hypothetical protein
MCPLFSESIQRDLYLITSFVYGILIRDFDRMAEKALCYFVSVGETFH